MIHVALFGFIAQSIKSAAIISEKWEKKEGGREGGRRRMEKLGRKYGKAKDKSPCLHSSEFNWALQEKTPK